LQQEKGKFSSSSYSYKSASPKTVRVRDYTRKNEIYTQSHNKTSQKMQRKEFKIINLN
jgi:hypothetical protein